MKLGICGLVCALIMGFFQAVEANLLGNPGFEDAGNSSDDARHWEWGNPDIHGGLWGTAARRNWHARSGEWSGAIQGRWAGDTAGGWWQEKQAAPGATYTLSGWFRADANWTNQSNQGIKLEFYTGEYHGQTLLGDERLYFDGIGESWVQQTVSAVAPENAQWVRAVIWADGFGDEGVLYADDISLVGEPGTVIILSTMPLIFLGMSLAGLIFVRLGRKS